MALINYIIRNKLILELRKQKIWILNFLILVVCIWVLKDLTGKNLEFLLANFVNIMPYLGFSILFAAYATATIVKN